MCTHTQYSTNVQQKTSLGMARGEWQFYLVHKSYQSEKEAAQKGEHIAHPTQALPNSLPNQQEGK